MKRIFLAFASVLTLAGAANAEPTQVNGYVGGDYTWAHASASGVGGTDVNIWGGSGAVSFPITGAFGGQFDGDIHGFDFGHGLGSETVVSPTGHAYYRAANWLGGAYVGGEFANHLNLWGGGLEGQLFPTDQITLDGSAGYGNIHKFGADLNLWSVRLGGRYFITPNLDLGAKVDFMRGDASGGHADLWTEGVNGEWKLDKAPVSFTLGYEHGDLSGFSAHSDAVKVGVRYVFGGTLRDRDTKGAGLPSLSETFGGETGEALVGLGSKVGGFFP